MSLNRGTPSPSHNTSTSIDPISFPGGTPSPSLVPYPFWGTSSLGQDGVPPGRDWMGYPWPGLDGLPPTRTGWVTPWPGWGTPSAWKGWGTPQQDWMGYALPLTRTGWHLDRFPIGLSCYRPPSEGWWKVIFSVCPHFGGGPRSGLRFSGGLPSLRFWGGPGLRFWGGPLSDFQGGVLVSDFWEGYQSQIFGGIPSLRFSGGYPVSDFWGGGYPVSDFRGVYPVSVKVKIFDTRFGLIHVQTGKQIFCQGTPSPDSKGKIFWHQIWLDTCSDWEKKFVEGPPPPVKGKIFDTRFGLIHVQTGEKIFCRGTPPPK